MKQYFKNLDDSSIRMLWRDIASLNLAEKCEVVNQIIVRGFVSEDELNPSGHTFYELHKLKEKELNKLEII